MKFIVVGYRPAGDSVALTDRMPRWRALLWLHRFRLALEGYDHIEAEEVEVYAVDRRGIDRPYGTICRHCHTNRVNRPRGLCYSCYYKPSVLALYPSTSKYARRKEDWYYPERFGRPGPHNAGRPESLLQDAGPGRAEREQGRRAGR